MLGGCRHGDEQPAEPRREGIVVTTGEIEAEYVAGNVLHRREGRERLGGEIATTLIGNLAPAAVPDPTGRRLAYNSWHAKRPVVRVREADGEDRLLADGAHSPAWRHDGALAHFQALRPALPDLEAISRYRGHVVVRERPAADPVRWTRRPGRYVVAAWAGDRLLAYRLTASWPDLLVLDGPRRVRALGEGLALVAVSPDGTRAFVSAYGAAPPLVRVLDVATGRELARAAVPGLDWLTEAGSWTGDRVVATASDGLALFRVGDGSIELARLLRIPRGEFPIGVFEPQLADGRRVAAWGELPERPRQAVAAAAVVECDLVELSCVRAPEVSSALGPRLVYDPSRP